MYEIEGQSLPAVFEHTIARSLIQTTMAQQLSRGDSLSGGAFNFQFDLFFNESMHLAPLLIASTTSTKTLLSHSHRMQLPRAANLKPEVRHFLSRRFHLY